MPSPEQICWQESKHEPADLVCPHCRGLLSHEHWCCTQNLNVQYAFQVVYYPERLTCHDSLILHALGVTWGK